MDYTTFLPLYQNPDPASKDAKWFNEAVTMFRRNWYPIVNPNDAIHRKQLLDGRQSIQNVIDSFADKDFIKHGNIKPLKIMNVFYKTLAEDLKANPPRAELIAVDPTAVAEKKEDILMLKNRKILERDRSELQRRIGLPKYTMPYDKFNGNAEQFDSLGLDDQDPDDTTFYEENLQKMNYEIAAQNLVNSVIKLSRVDEGTATNSARDILANNVICGQSYVDEISGEIRCQEYIYPEEFWGIFSDSEDGFNDVCKGWQRQLTVGEFIRRAGNDFDWERDWPQLLFAINYCMNTKYTGFVRNGFTYCCTLNDTLWAQGGFQGEKQQNCCQWNIAYMYKVWCGYIEWPCPEATASYVERKDNPDDFVSVPYSYDFDNKEMRTEYQKKSWYQEQMYKAFFIATTMTSQWIFNFGKVYHQLLEGANDQYAKWTLWSYREPGSTAVEVAEPYIDFANFAFYKVKFLLYKAKPEDEQYLLEELITLSKGFQQLNPQQGTNAQTPLSQNIIDQIIQYQRGKTIKIRTFPEINGKKEATLAPLHNDARGADPLMGVMQAMVMWAQEQIAIQLGVNAMRIGGNPQPRESYKSEQATVQLSYTSTNYIYRMVQYMKMHMATVATLYAQDVVKFKDSIPYKWLTNLIGNENIASIEALEKMSAHRFGIFVEDQNTAIKREEVKQAATIALQQKQITFSQWALVTQVTDYKKSIMLLAHYEKKKIKQERQFEMQKIAAQDQVNAAEHQREMERMAFERETKYGVADREANAYIASAQINKTAKTDTQELKEASKIPQQQAKTQGEIEKEKAKADIEAQEPLA